PESRTDPSYCLTANTAITPPALSQLAKVNQGSNGKRAPGTFKARPTGPANCERRASSQRSTLRANEQYDDMTLAPASARQPARSSSAVSVGRVNTYKCRGGSRPSQFGPNSRRSRLCQLGTLMATRPPGRSKEAVRANSAEGEWTCSKTSQKVMA